MSYADGEDVELHIGLVSVCHMTFKLLNKISIEINQFSHHWTESGGKFEKKSSEMHIRAV